LEVTSDRGPFVPFFGCNYSGFSNFKFRVETKVFTIAPDDGTLHASFVSKGVSGIYLFAVMVGV